MERYHTTPPICPVCGLGMIPTKLAVIAPHIRPTFSCYGCGVTALGDPAKP